jgi:hypothetical protein
LPNGVAENYSTSGKKAKSTLIRFISRISYFRSSPQAKKTEADVSIFTKHIGYERKKFSTSYCTGEAQHPQRARVLPNLQPFNPIAIPLQAESQKPY